MVVWGSAGFAFVLRHESKLPGRRMVTWERRFPEGMATAQSETPLSSETCRLGPCSPWPGGSWGRWAHGAGPPSQSSSLVHEDPLMGRDHLCPIVLPASLSCLSNRKSLWVVILAPWPTGEDVSEGAQRSLCLCGISKMKPSWTDGVPACHFSWLRDLKQPQPGVLARPTLWDVHVCTLLRMGNGSQIVGDGRLPKVSVAGPCAQALSRPLGSVSRTPDPPIRCRRRDELSGARGGRHPSFAHPQPLCNAVRALGPQVLSRWIKQQAVKTTRRNGRDMQGD